MVVLGKGTLLTSMLGKVISKGMSLSITKIRSKSERLLSGHQQEKVTGRLFRNLLRTETFTYPRTGSLGGLGSVSGGWCLPSTEHGI